MLDNGKYNKIKLLHQLSGITWFIEKYGLDDAKNQGDTKCESTLKDLKKELEKYIKEIHALLD